MLDKTPARHQERGRHKSDDRGSGTGGTKDKLPVVEVGKYAASFVPAIKDFARLDKQFRLPDGFIGLCLVGVEVRRARQAAVAQAFGPQAIERAAARHGEQPAERAAASGVEQGDVAPRLDVA